MGLPKGSTTGLLAEIIPFVKQMDERVDYLGELALIREELLADLKLLSVMDAKAFVAWRRELSAAADNTSYTINDVYRTAIIGARQGNLSPGEAQDFSRQALIWADVLQASPEDAANVLITLQSGMSLSNDEVQHFGDALISLSSMNRLNRASLAEYVRQISAVAHGYGINAHQTLALSALFTKPGITPEEGGKVVNGALRSLHNLPERLKKEPELVNELKSIALQPEALEAEIAANPATALVNLLERVRDSGKPPMPLLNKLFDDGADTLLRVLPSTDVFFRIPQIVKSEYTLGAFTNAVNSSPHTFGKLIRAKKAAQEDFDSEIGEMLSGREKYTTNQNHDIYLHFFLNGMEDTVSSLDLLSQEKAVITVEPSRQFSLPIQTATLSPTPAYASMPSPARPSPKAEPLLSVNTSGACAPQKKADTRVTQARSGALQSSSRDNANAWELSAQLTEPSASPSLDFSFHKSAGGQAQGQTGCPVFNLHFPITGVADMDFATRVMATLRSRQNELCDLIGNIVNTQRRVAYE